MEAARNPWPALGTLLVRDGAVTAEQLERAIAEKRNTPEKRLGEILVEQGSTTRAQIARILAEQHELEYIELDHGSIEIDAAGLLPENLARRYLAVPVRFLDDGSVLVAVSDPTNVLFSDELRLALGVPVRVGVASADAIERAIGRVHEEGVELQEIVEEEDDKSATVLDLDNESPAVLFVNKTINRALDIGASDIHFSPQQRRLNVRARVDGVVRDVTTIATSHTAAVTSRLKIMGGLDIAERRAPQDGRVSIRRGAQTVDIRMAVLPTTHGEKVTLRILNTREAPGSLEELDIWQRSRELLRAAIDQPYGSVVVVGPTGSGKTTTLYGCLQHLNSPERTLMTIEDPVEYRAEGLDQIEVNIRAGLTFASGLRTILRSDPDVILVGEIRDEETAQIAFRAAMTGHLVLTTLHAQTAASAIQRLLDIHVDPGVISTSINCFVAQRLARRLCKDCAEPYQADQSELATIGVPAEYGDLQLFRAVGCPECGGIGYRGRVGLFEVMPMSDEISRLIGAPTREIEAEAVRRGMFTMRDDGIRLSMAGLTTLDEVRRVAGDRSLLGQ
ncbi:MAG: type II secretion system protein GspE [Actinobacteria bacterium]|nr:MAG: type II secretion system protein GspE [Actinomycetota bacterium]